MVLKNFLTLFRTFFWKDESGFQKKILLFLTFGAVIRDFTDNHGHNIQRLLDSLPKVLLLQQMKWSVVISKNNARHELTNDLRLETDCVRHSFYQSCRKNRCRDSCFHDNFVKFLRALFLQNTFLITIFKKC